MKYAVLILTALTSSLAVSSHAAIVQAGAVLSGPAEFPVNASPGLGTASIFYDSTAHTLQVDVFFSGLLGTTTASHIHCCVSPNAATPTAGVATTTPTFTGFPLGVTSGSYSHLFDLTLASSYNPAFVTVNGSIAASEAALAGFLTGQTYLNIHTNVFPGGEIRGFLVPEPSTGILFGTALAGLWLARRRRAA